MDRPTLELWRDRGMDLQLLEDDTRSALSLPVSHHAALSVLPALDGADHISALPDALLRNIVSRLPVNDAACTAALSWRWRGHSTPLILVDVHLTSSHVEAFPSLLARTSPLSVKGVRHLVLVNRPWPLNVDLPATFFGMRTVAFPHLKELGLSCMGIENWDMDFVLAKSPVLSLRCVQIIEEGIELEIAVEDAPPLERLMCGHHQPATSCPGGSRLAMPRH
ncbi:LOW QUALITY PROTEIN: hypothetical protein SETIT_5G032500v2 [Setaria italica]|uniref:Uncharacterized protein n=2 Tax=Setaria italica TaxID=4555 RepID=A0A368R152_SETIT|nr:LOW QUALITY PROTEIN: hypothetical protein SETIT_5G032500v2 [Setaria italica]